MNRGKQVEICLATFDNIFKNFIRAIVLDCVSVYSGHFHKQQSRVGVAIFILNFWELKFQIFWTLLKSIYANVIWATNNLKHLYFDSIYQFSSEVCNWRFQVPLEWKRSPWLHLLFKTKLDNHLLVCIMHLIIKICASFILICHFSTLCELSVFMILK